MFSYSHCYFGQVTVTIISVQFAIRIILILQYDFYSVFTSVKDVGSAYGHRLTVIEIMMLIIYLVNYFSNADFSFFLLQNAYAKYVKEYYLGSFGVNVQTYNQKHLKNTTPGKDSSDRLWWFQVCSEVAYFQVAPANDSIRSEKVDTRYIVQTISTYMMLDIDPCLVLFSLNI